MGSPLLTTISIVVIGMSEFFDYVVNARTDSDNILQLVSIFVDRGANVNHRMNRHYFFNCSTRRERVTYALTPLDRFNNRYNVHNNYRLAADIIRAAGGKCLSTCLTVNGVRDITLAPSPFRRLR